MKLVILLLSLLVLTSPAFARTVDVYDDHGGSVAQYDAQWTAMAAEGVSVRIVGPCQSACTDLLGHIPRSRICVMPQARFGFHLANLPSAQATLWAAYAPDIRAWITAHGGLKKDFIWMAAPDIDRFLHRC